MNALYIRDKNGNFIPIPTISGKDGKTAYQYAVEGGYTGTEAEFARKLAEELPEPYTLPAATADRLGGVKVGSDFFMDGEKLALSNGLTLLDSVEVKEGELITNFLWRYPNAKEIQLFMFVPKQPTNARVVAYFSGVGVYMPDMLSSVADQYAWVRYENRENTFPVSGVQCAREGYSNLIKTIGLYLAAFSKVAEVSINFSSIAQGYPVGTKISVYGR